MQHGEVFENVGEQTMTRIVVVSDIRLYREGLSEILSRDGRISVVGQAACRESAIDLTSRLDHDAALLDMAMPEALGLAASLRTDDSGVKIIALGISETAEDVIACVEAGIQGYICRGSSTEDLVQTIKDTVEGKLRCSSGVAAALMRRVAFLAAGGQTGPDQIRLTQREMEVANLIDLGCSNKQIAAQLHIEVSTTKNHVHNILDKLGVNRRSEAVSRLRQRGLLQPQRVS